MHYRATTGIGFPRQAAGLSIVELMIALTLLALVSIAGLQVLQFSQSSFSEGRAVLSAQQKNQAIAAYINQDFRNGTCRYRIPSPILSYGLVARSPEKTVAKHPAKDDI